jgi:hypothetical protein
MALRLALIAGVALVLTSPAAATALKTRTAELGPVRATVSWQSANEIQAKSVRVEITRDEQRVLARRLGPAIPQAIKVRDLDGNGEPEVVADFYTGGAHCCLFSLIYRYTGSAYSRLKHMWGNPSYGLRDLDHDGTPELVTADDRFAYAFTSYAGSALPIRAWRYRNGQMSAVTRRFPALVRNDAANLWKDYLEQRERDFPDPRGILAAWMADEYVLGTQAKGWATLRRVNARGEFSGIEGGDVWAEGDAYLTKLRRFLTVHGYARKGRGPASGS